MKILSVFLFAALCLLLPASAQVINPGTGGGGGGSGTVTSVGFTGGLVSVATPTTTPAFTVAGTSGGIPYFSSASTWATSAAGTVNHVVGWGGAGSAPVDLGVLPPGTVTSIATTGPITGGTITGAGTIACATCGVTGSPLSQFASTTSAQMAGVLSDETGSGVAVFGTSPTIAAPTLTGTVSLNGSLFGATNLRLGTAAVFPEPAVNDASGGGQAVESINNGTGQPQQFLASSFCAGTGFPIITCAAQVKNDGTLLFALGGGQVVKTGSNGRVGTGTLSGGTLAVANTGVTANSYVFVQDTGGGIIANIGALYIASQTAGTGFTVTSSSAIDTSTFRYWIFETN